MRLQLHCMDGKSSRLSACHLVERSYGIVVLEGEFGQIKYSLHDLLISPRLGQSPRRVVFPDGRICETKESDAIDALLERNGVKNKGWVLYQLESKLRYMVAAFLIAVVIATLAIKYGMPSLAKQIAFLVPLQTESLFLGDDILSVLDKTIFEPTALSAKHQQIINARFRQMTSPIKGGYNFRLVFRGGGVSGANAFALPTGTVVVTDQLIHQSNNIDETASIMAHEIGHIVHRHSLRHLIQSSAIGLLIITVTGDFSTVSALAASLPAILIETHYSREFEREADQYAYDYLVNNGISIAHFKNIIQRITAENNDRGFLATHPSADERALMFTQ